MTTKSKKTKTQPACTPVFRPVKPLTENQHRLIEAIEDNTITFAVGKPGTGKSVISVGKAVEALMTHEVDKIILTRPIIEAGESMGFLPGSFQEKIHPYLIPLFDALELFITPTQIKELRGLNKIDIVPLNYMRGRSLRNSFVIFDEMQNATYPQLTMALTRLASGSKFVLNGDLKQSDLHSKMQGGLRRCIEGLGNIEDIDIVELTDEDIVRHPLVSAIVDALEL